ncbi:MAG: tRNA pseudouridine(55) synthase TruB [Propionibacteriaceae bacterium]|jgi:tRNA pseudouridine55 synthase|nr:tRNA pseudouridine(55) synthase TruB [Propionibacteriaceae bacterium]
MSDASGIVLVDKPGGWTSHDVVARMRRIVGTKKVGHAGTLDPMATGLLIIGVNKATRLLGHLAAHEKTYLATIRLGQATNTDDAEGEVTSTPGTKSLAPSQIETALTSFRGTIAQVPSQFSAIKVNGQRAYAQARAGKEVKLAAREVTVSRFDLLRLRQAEVGRLPVIDVDVEVTCSAGTYIRALARDLGAALHTGGHLTALRRTAIAGFDFTRPHLSPVQITNPLPPDERLPVPLLPLAEVARSSFDFLDVDERMAKEISYGRPVPFVVAADPTALLHADKLLALYRPDCQRSVPVAVFL